MLSVHYFHTFTYWVSDRQQLMCQCKDSELDFLSRFVNWFVCLDQGNVGVMLNVDFLHAVDTVVTVLVKLYLQVQPTPGLRHRWDKQLHTASS